MKKMLKSQAGAAFIVVILVIVLALVGGGAAFLTVRMVVSGDGNFLQPFEELGWIDPKEDDDDEKEESKNEKKDTDDDEDEDEDENEDDEKDDEEKTEKSKKSGNTSKYLVDESRLSSEAKKSGVDHYYGEIDMTSQIGDKDSEYADLYKYIKAGINLYAKDGKTIEIEFGFDVKEFCEKAFENYKEDFEKSGISSSKDLEDMMMSALETMFDSMDDDTSEYITKYTEDGSLQLYVTEKGFESLYKTYDIEDGDDDIEILIDSLEDYFKTKIKLVD